MRRGLVVAAVTVVAVALGIGANLVEDRLKPYGPTGVDGTVGEDIDVFPYRVHVHDAQVATHVLDTGVFEATTVDSDGVWVVVELSYATFDEVRSPFGSGMVVRDDRGREYPISARADASEWLAGADIWVRGQLAFEVAPDAVDSLSLVFDPTFALYGPLPTTYATIPLALDGVDVVESVELTDIEVLPVGER